MFITESGWNFTKQLKWLDKYLLGHNGFIAGGFAKDIFLGNKVKDLDIFFWNNEDFEAAVQYYKSHDGYMFYYGNDNVMAYQSVLSGTVLELNRKIFGTPEEIIAQFDFTIAKFAYYTFTEESTVTKSDENGNVYEEPWYDENGDPTMRQVWNAVYHPKFFEHLNLKRLVIDSRIPYPISTFHRMFKYGKRGFFPCRETKIKLIKELWMLPEETLQRSMNDISFYITDGVD